MKLLPAFLLSHSWGAVHREFPHFPHFALPPPPSSPGLTTMHTTLSSLAICGIPGISDEGHSGVPEANTLFIEFLGNSDSYASFAIGFQT